MEREPTDEERKLAAGERRPRAHEHMQRVGAIVPGATWTLSFTPTLQSLLDLRRYLPEGKKDAVAKAPAGGDGVRAGGWKAAGVHRVQQSFCGESRSEGKAVR
eukprot:2735835-Rhodomonas_salina.2